MHYICVENNQVVSVMPYKPNVPSSVQVHTISQREYDLLVEGTYYFDINSKKVVKQSDKVLTAKAAEKANIEHIEFLNSTDWQVLRHIREKALNLPTTMTEQEYIKLENDRQTAAKKIIK